MFISGRLPEGQYKLKLTTSIRSSRGRAVEHSMQDAVEHEMERAMEHDEAEITELCLLFSGMVIDGASKGSVIIHLHPVTDDALQRLLDAQTNGSMHRFVKCILDKCSLGKQFEGQEVTFKIQLEKDLEGTSQRKSGMINIKYWMYEFECPNLVTKLKMKQIT